MVEPRVRPVLASSRDHQNSVPLVQMQCRMTASLRATAIRASRPPIRLTRRMPYAFGGENRCTRVSSTLAASYRQVRTKVSPHREMRSCRSVSPDW